MVHSPRMRTIFGQPSHVISSDRVRLAVTEQAGHMAPVTFTLGSRTIEPFAVAPWWNEPTGRDLPQLLRVLRGDFFCMPFGGNSTPYRGERHPPHGDPANHRWRLVESVSSRGQTRLHLTMKTRTRPGQVDKVIRLVPGHAAIYQEHTITGMTGPMTFGHHPCLKFPDREGAGRLSFSRFALGQVVPEPVELPANRGYSLLKPGALVSPDLSVATITGETADLSRYPARRGFEDIVILVADPALDVAWNAVAFPEQGYVWFALRDPNMLASTLLWISNGGRHYPPWNGRHVNVMGIENITNYYHYGLAESVKPNPLSRQGFKTHHVLHKDTPCRIRHIMGVAAIPRSFDRVRDIEVHSDHITLVSTTGKQVRAPLDTGFLRESTRPTVVF
jgi:hypothetical protein